MAYNKKQIEQALSGLKKALPKAARAGAEHRASKHVERLIAGTKVRKGITVPLTAADTALTVAKVVALGGTVPDGVVGRFQFAGAEDALRVVAESVGCDPSKLVAVLIPPPAHSSDGAPEAPVALDERRAAGRRR